MNDTLKKVDQERKHPTPKGGWTVRQRLERLETQARLWWKRRMLEKEDDRPEPVRQEKRETGGSRTRSKTQTYAPRAAEVRETAPSAGKRVAAAAAAGGLTLAGIRTAVSRNLSRTRRRWGQIRKEAKAHHFPESNRWPIQLVLMFTGLVPMVGSLLREKLRIRRQKAVHRGSLGRWLEGRKAPPVTYFAVVAVLAVGALAVSFYTFGTTVTYDGEVVGKVSSEKMAKSACQGLEKITSDVLGREYAIDSNLLNYSSGLMLRRELMEPEELQEELADRTGRLVTYGYTLVVDGEVLGATPYEGAMEELLQQLKDGVSDENTISCSFQEEVEVRPGYVASDRIMNLGHVAERLYSTKTEEVTYTVKAGDTWSEIAEDHDLTSSELLALNPGYNINRLSIGEVLTLSASVPYLTLTVTERECYVADVPYDVEYTPSDYLYKDQEQVLSPGSFGKADTVANVTYVNGVETERTVLSSVTLREPVTEQRARGTKERPSWHPTGTFRWPCSGNVTSRFGYRNLKYSFASTNHKGIDIANRKGTPIYASDGGRVVYAGWMSGYGYLVQIDHLNGYVTYYGHNSSLLVSVGETVHKGEQIARMGSTGNSSGNHCHFEIRYNGVPKNPLNYI